MPLKSVLIVINNKKGDRNVKQEYGNYWYKPNKKVKQLRYTINNIEKQLKVKEDIMFNYEIRFYDPKIDLPLDKWNEDGFKNYKPEMTLKFQTGEILLEEMERFLKSHEGYPCIIFDIKDNRVLAGGAFAPEDLDTVEECL